MERRRRDRLRFIALLVARKAAVSLAFLGKSKAFQGVSGVQIRLSADQLSVSDNDGDGRPDGRPDVTSLASGSGYWAGSDVTVNPKPLFIGDKFESLAR